MKMENLNKTQIVLLTLLTSFVTSIATGIVTVTLLDQAPPAVTRTINRVVEKTIQTVVPGENQVTTVVKEVIVKEEDQIVGAVEKASKSLVQVSAVDADGNEVLLGLGVVVSGDGFMIADKNRVAGNRNNLVVSMGGQSMNVEIVSEEEDFVILKAIELENTEVKEGGEGENTNTEEETKNTKISLTPVSLIDSDNIKLGQAVVSLAGAGGNTVLTGIVSRLDTEMVVIGDEENTEDVLKYIVPSFEIGKKSAGGPLLDMSGNLLGINVITLDGEIFSVPVNLVKEALFNIANIAQDATVDDKNIDGEVAEDSGDLTKSE